MIIIFYFYLAAPRPTLGIIKGTASLTMLITTFLQFRLEGHQEPCNEVGSLCQTKHLVGFEPATFEFLLQRLKPLGCNSFLLLYDWVLNTHLTRGFILSKSVVLQINTSLQKSFDFKAMFADDKKRYKGVVLPAEKVHK